MSVCFEYDDFFVNSKYSCQIDSILQNTDLEINFKCGGSVVKKMCSVVAEKIELQSLIQIRIFDKYDRTKMFISTIDLSYFNYLKQDQSLHVTFAGFVENLTKILAECERRKLGINLTEEQGKFIMQFYEYRQFKNLVHLSLPLKEAPLALVVFYMNKLVDNAQRDKLAQDKLIANMRNEIDYKTEQINQLKCELSKINSEFLERENRVRASFANELEIANANLNKIVEERRLDEITYSDKMGKLQKKLEHLQNQYSKIEEDKLHEQKKCEQLQEELGCLKSKTVILKEHNDRLHADLASAKNAERRHEIHLKNAKQNVYELEEKLRKYEKLQEELRAELEAERRICQTKRKALEIATEEIEKANGIIAKQAFDMKNIRKVLDLRTDIALKQETEVTRKDKLNEALSQELVRLKTDLENLREQSEGFSTHLNSVKDLAHQMNDKYSKRIIDLNEKLKDTGLQKYY